MLPVANAHSAKTTALLVETFAVFAALATLTVVAHEASHGKLWPSRRRMNDLWGQLLLVT
jgi:fatty acid desaturase